MSRGCLDRTDKLITEMTLDGSRKLAENGIKINIIPLSIYYHISSQYFKTL
jgi:hypothetical protein